MLLRPFTRADAPFVLRLLNSEGWLQFIGDRAVHSITAAEQYIENRIISSYKTNGFGMFLMELKSSGMPVGMCGLVKRTELPGPDLGFALLPEQGGKGYALEAARTVMQYAAQERMVKKLWAIVAPGNQASIKLLEKLGFTFTQNILIGSESLLSFEHEIEANLYW